MPTRNINLTAHFDTFVQRQLTSGRYGNASEIVREALRLLEEQEQEKEAKLKVLRRAAREGFEEIDQGKGIVLRGRKALGTLFKDIETQVLGNAARSGG